MQLIQTTLLSQILTTLPIEARSGFENDLSHYRETLNCDSKNFDQGSARELIQKLYSDFGNLTYVVKSSGIYPANQVYFQLTNIKASLPVENPKDSQPSRADGAFANASNVYAIDENIQTGDPYDQDVGLDFYSTYEPGDIDPNIIVLVQIQFKKYKSRQNMGWSLKQAAFDFVRFGIRSSGTFDISSINSDVANAYTIMTYQSLLDFTKEIEKIQPALQFFKVEDN